jgi:hypothetical protein
MVCAIAPQASFIAKANRASHVCGRRGFAAAAPCRQAYRRRVGVSPATVSRSLRRLGFNRLSALEPAEPVRRCEHPGELIHIDIKKLGRFNRVGHRITKDRTRRSSGRGVRDAKS